MAVSPRCIGDIYTSNIFFFCVRTGRSQEQELEDIFLLFAFCLAVFSFSTYFKTGVSFRYESFYWINPGSYYIIFPAFFLTYVIACLVIYVRAYRKSQDRLFRAQMRSMFIASLVGFGGGVTNFLPQIFNVYPFGNFLTLLYLFFMSYGVLKYKFISKKIISSQLLVGAVVLIFLFNLLQLLQLGSNATFGNILIALLLLILVSIFGVLIVHGVYREVSQREKIQLLATDLQTANDAQVNLIHIMNHQIKGRFSDARSAFAMLLEGEYGVISEEAKVILQKGLEQTEIGVDYVQGILKGLSATNGTLPYDMKDLDLKALIKSVTDRLASKATEKKLKFEVNLADGDFKINGDGIQLSEVVGNLINNSIAYTPAGSIHVWLTKKGNKALVAVQDTGVGITEEDKLKLFKTGGRGKDSIKVNINSTGYGLSFVKGVVEAHKGRVWAESDGPGKGSSFYMEVPLIG